MNIHFACNKDNNIVLPVLNKLFKVNAKITIVDNLICSIPIMWVGDSCYTGITEITKKINRIIFTSLAKENKKVQ